MAITHLSVRLNVGDQAVQQLDGLVSVNLRADRHKHRAFEYSSGWVAEILDLVTGISEGLDAVVRHREKFPTSHFVGTHNVSPIRLEHTFETRVEAF